MTESTTTPQQLSDTHFLTIGEAADMVGVSVPTLRMYEREGLIIPYRRDSKHRRFSTTDIERIRCIREMINKEKVSIEGIKRLLSLLPCWKIKNCPEEVRVSCPAFEQYSEPCWMVSEKPWECKNAQCRFCPVYADNASCGSLKNTIAKFTLNEAVTNHASEKS